MSNFHGNTSEKGRNAVNVRWKKRETSFKILIKGRNSDFYKKLKASLCGYLIGDGSVYSHLEKNNKHHYTLAYYPDHISTAKIYANLIYKLYNIKPKIKLDKKSNNYYRIIISNKLIYNDLIRLTKFGSLEWKIPNFIKHKKFQKEFLKAFFDCEAYVGPKYIQVQSVNKHGLEAIKLLLYKLGVGSKIYVYNRKNKNWNTNYLLTIIKKDDRIKFLKYIGFNHTVKLKKLKNYLD